MKSINKYQMSINGIAKYEMKIMAKWHQWPIMAYKWQS